MTRWWSNCLKFDLGILGKGQSGQCRQNSAKKGCQRSAYWSQLDTRRDADSRLSRGPFSDAAPWIIAPRPHVSQGEAGEPPKHIASSAGILDSRLP